MFEGNPAVRIRSPPNMVASDEQLVLGRYRGLSQRDLGACHKGCCVLLDACTAASRRNLQGKLVLATAPGCGKNADGRLSL